MNAADRAKRDLEIVRMRKEGQRVTAIARFFGLKVQRVNRILRAQRQPRAQRVANMWDVDHHPDDLRRMIAAKAREGARAALEAHV